MLLMMRTYFPDVLKELCGGRVLDGEAVARIAGGPAERSWRFLGTGPLDQAAAF
jgi:hypothetical protein